MINTTKIAERLKGRKIVDVVIDYHIEDDDNKNDFLEVDGEECYIVLDNGEVIKCWNSEWGGLSLGKTEKYYNTFTKSEMIRFIDT